MVATWPIRRRMGQVTWSTPVPMVTNAPNGKRQDSEWRGSTCWCARRRIAAWRSRSSSCRFPREMRPVPLNLRPCSADPAPTPLNRLSTRRLRRLRHVDWRRIGGTFCRIAAPRAEQGRLSRGIAPPRTPRVGASRVESYIGVTASAQRAQRAAHTGSRGRRTLSMCSEIWHGFVRRDSPEKPCRTYGQMLSPGSCAPRQKSRSRSCRRPGCP